MTMNYSSGGKIWLTPLAGIVKLFHWLGDNSTFAGIPAHKNAFVHAKVSLYWSTVMFHDSLEGDTVVSFDTKFIDMSRDLCTTTNLKNHIRREVFVYDFRSMLGAICEAWNVPNFKQKPEAILNIKCVKKHPLRSVYFLEISILITILNTHSMSKSFLLCFNFIHNVELTFHYKISLHYFHFLKFPYWDQMFWIYNTDKLLSSLISISPRNMVLKSSPGR